MNEGNTEVSDSLAEELLQLRQQFMASESFLAARMDAIEKTLNDLAAKIEHDRTNLTRRVDMKTGRAGEMSSRIAQRLSKCETAIEILARLEDSETVDHA